MSIVKLFSRRKNSVDRFEQIIAPHITTLFHFAFHLALSSDGAEELVQSLLTRLFSKVDELEKLDNLQTWLKRSLYNLYVDSYRKQKRLLNVISGEAIPDNIVAHDKTPYEDVELNHNQQVIVSAMNQLNDDQRVVVMLHDAEGYTLIELSEILQTPLGTLKSRLHRARAQIRALTEMELFGDSRRVSNKETIKL